MNPVCCDQVVSTNKAQATEGRVQGDGIGVLAILSIAVNWSDSKAQNCIMEVVPVAVTSRISY